MYIAFGPLTAIDLEKEILFQERGEQLKNVLQKLPQGQHRTLTLFTLRIMELCEISETLREPVGNVRDQYYRGSREIEEVYLRRERRFAEVPTFQLTCWQGAEKDQGTTGAQLGNGATCRKQLKAAGLWIELLSPEPEVCTRIAQLAPFLSIS